MKVFNIGDEVRRNYEEEGKYMQGIITEVLNEDRIRIEVTDKGGDISASIGSRNGFGFDYYPGKGFDDLIIVKSAHKYPRIKTRFLDGYTV